MAPRLNIDKAHVQLPTPLAKACLAAGAKRLLHISALGADVNAPSMYQRSKARGELVLQGHIAQGLALTLLRPSVIFGEDDAFINVFAKLQALAPVVPLAGAHTRFQPGMGLRCRASLAVCGATPQHRRSYL
jgi:NADH dehydrogenase